MSDVGFHYYYYSIQILIVPISETIVETPNQHLYCAVLCTMSGCPMSRVAEVAGVVMVITFLAKATKAFSAGSSAPSSAPKGTNAAIGGKTGTSISRGSNRLPTEL